MCGIVGYIGAYANAQAFLLRGLETLEYRGYDSSGIALVQNNIHRTRAKGTVVNLKSKLREQNIGESTCGIAHTRWATHGEPSKRNAHPHQSGMCTLVHNGIIENYLELKHQLLEEGVIFTSDTDTEVACAWMNRSFSQHKDPILAIQQACRDFRGSFAFAILFEHDTQLYVTRRNNPLLIGVGEHSRVIASDLSAIISETKNYMELENDDIAALSSMHHVIYNKDLELQNYPFQQTTLSIQTLGKQGFEHYMLKEIHEQPHIARERLDTSIHYDFSNYDALYIIACGSALYAGSVIKYLFEKHLKIPVHLEVASEFRYFPPVLTKKPLGIFISQSGETADSVASLQWANQHMDTLAIVNVENSQIARLAKDVIYTNAGIEISVATTKAYFSQVLTLLKASGIPYDETHFLEAIDHVLQMKFTTSMIEELSKKEFAFFLGRGIDYALCLEGALKLKEISYIHAQAYQAGELKHGTISLIEDDCFVVSMISDESIAEKTISNIVETQARGAKVILFIKEDIDVTYQNMDHVILLPAVDPLLQPLVNIIVLQRFAYEVAKRKGCEIDQPKNLAKSVSVE